MKKVLLIITIIAAVIIIIYGASLVLDYMVTSKYHVQDGTKDKIIYTTSERAKEIAFLNRYLFNHCLCTYIIDIKFSSYFFKELIESL